MRIKKLILDLDGVMVDFVTAAMHKTGVIGYQNSEYPVRAGWNIVKARNILAKKTSYLRPMSDKQFWQHFDLIDFWANLDYWPGALSFWNKLRWGFGVDNIFVCTSGLTPEAAAGKSIWVKNMLPGFNPKHLFIGTSKHLLAGPDRILVDDRDKNCLDFYEAGGMGVLVPRPWNSATMIDDREFKSTINSLHMMNVSMPE